MDCFYPGRVLVGPGLESEGGPYLAETLGKEFGGDFEFEFGVDDVLGRNELDPHKLQGKRTLPFVGRVPEGMEAEMAARISQFSPIQVGAATPDYLVRPAASITIDDVVLAKAINAVDGLPKGTQCGYSTVAIIDSGVDPSLVPGANLYPRQYDALSPLGAMASPLDHLGHGSLVARIVSETAPAAQLISVRAFDQDGTISSVIAALYLAQAAGPCDVINLSFSVSCAPEACTVCGTPAQASTNAEQVKYFFHTFKHGAPDTVLVAAAGNNVNQLTLPAVFEDVIAVGSFDYDTHTPISAFQQVPTGRFAFAPGGRGVAGAAFAQRAGFRKPDYMHGTSFATAFVTAFAARVVCARRGNCGTPLKSHAVGADLYAAVLAEIAARADTSWPGFDPMRHGLGAIRFF
jgi:Subtilase family